MPWTAKRASICREKFGNDIAVRDTERDRTSNIAVVFGVVSQFDDDRRSVANDLAKETVAITADKDRTSPQRCRSCPACFRQKEPDILPDARFDADQASNTMIVDLV